jgi:hypothetical protein
MSRVDHHHTANVRSAEVSRTASFSGSSAFHPAARVGDECKACCMAFGKLCGPCLRKTMPPCLASAQPNIRVASRDECDGQEIDLW